MKRRVFIRSSALVSIGMVMPMYSCGFEKGKREVWSESGMTAFEKQTFNLLKIWCDAMIRDQVDDKSNPVHDGALYCYACEVVHGRANEAVYPLMYMADATGEQKYLDAALKLLDWSVNVDGPKGSWTNMIDPKSWNGITVFGAIALGEALKYHGHLLSKDLKAKWDARLKEAIAFVYDRFDIHFSHINYRFTAIYALYFLGHYFKEEAYIKRSKEFAALVPKYLTEPNKLIFGEDKPDNDKSAKGLYPIDIGYNVEESLNAVVQYAILEKDDVLLELLTTSMEGHLEFMLPDGAWDNSFGTRQNKWSYWGSRTTDGCQPGFALMAHRNPAFGTAAVLNTELLERCTVNGLLAGGLHYESHGIKPCIHHTFSHAKSLAFILDNTEKIGNLDKQTPVPRSVRNGVKHFPELDVWLGVRGPWKSTVSTYDQIWKKAYSVAGTGGALNVLWHDKVGPLFTASMAEYLVVEPFNQQPQPNADFCITPRVERWVDAVWYTNIHDLKAKVGFSDKDGTIDFKVMATLTNRDKEYAIDHANVVLNYQFDREKAILKARRTSEEANGDTFVVPIISQTGEKVVRPSKYIIELHKKEGIVRIVSNVPAKIKGRKEERIFNQVPGMEVLPLIFVFPKAIKEISCTITVT